MLKKILLFFIISTGLCLNAYKPEERNFLFSSEYLLFKSWLQTGSFSNRTPANISSSLIMVTYFTLDNIEKTKLSMVLMDNKISYILEEIPALKKLEIPDLKSEIRLIERFYYLLNSGYREVLTNFFTEISTSHDKETEIIDIYYDKQRGLKAVEKLFDDFKDRRAEVLDVVINESKNGLKIGIHLECDGEFNFFIRKNIESDIITKIGLEPKMKIKYGLEINNLEEYAYKKEVVTAPESLISHRKADIEASSKNTITTLLNSGKSWSRQMLHNKVGDVNQFLSNEFPSHEITIENKDIKIYADLFDNSFSSNIKINYQTTADGVYFFPSDEIFYEAGFITNASDDIVRVTDLNDFELNGIINYINHLVFMHRVIGSKLINFLLLPQRIPTLLLLYDNSEPFYTDRQLYELESYTDLILLLSYHWKDNRIVYFNIKEIKKINNKIEIHTILLSKDSSNKKADIADVHFIINENFKIDLVTFLIHTGVSLER